MVHVIQLRRDKLAEAMVAAGMSQQKHLATAMDMSEPAISRALNYGRFGEGFVANLLGCFPAARFEDLFEVVDRAHTRTLEQAADRVGVPVDWYRKRLNTGHLPGRMTRSRWSLCERDIAAAIEYCEVNRITTHPAMLNRPAP
ncbi:hypothetical protein [Prescottella equi]|uniref:hypothetical protein n=1 Tax=Rhodococcus hoagii TaxID=43767 RepID=UPI001C74001B|nr:hypothetical protein [Prescottella equi]BCN42227.1 hypothetical protein RE9414_05070 [Prescottella equi]